MIECCALNTPLIAKSDDNSGQTTGHLWSDLRNTGKELGLPADDATIPHAAAIPLKTGRLARERQWTELRFHWLSLMFAASAFLLTQHY